MDHLGRFVGVKDANIRYLALDAMTRMTRSDPKGPLRAQVSCVIRIANTAGRQEPTSVAFPAPGAKYLPSLSLSRLSLT
jgi:hypothetical protein